MGIYIYLNISDTITENEWKRAYQKSIKLVEKMPFIEKVVKECYGTKMICATKTVEKDYHGKIGWHTIGDSVSMKTAEDYFLPGNIITSEESDPYIDPYMSILPAYSDQSFEDERCNRIIGLWGNKTQAEPYHFYLLAIACMLEHELPGKVAIYGDITRGQCKRAVEIASGLLGEQIAMPDRCDLQKLYDRVRKMPLQLGEIVDAFAVLYMGNQDEEFGAFICRHFTDEERKAFWDKHFGYSRVGTYGFTDWLKKYLLWGFQVSDLKKYVRFDDEEKGDLPEIFVKEVLDTEVFLEEKDCEDVLEVDKDDEGSYSIYTLFAQFVFAGAKNHRVNRYIPLKELEVELAECVGNRCDVSKIVKEYMEEYAKKEAKSNPTDLLNDHMRSKRDEIISEREEYDVSNAEQLVFFESGDTIAPSLNGLLLDYFKFYRETIEESCYNDLLKADPADAIRYLMEENVYFLFMEESWDRIFKDIEDDIKTLERYYPMVRVKPSTDNQIQIVRALVLNDELYQYCLEQ